MAREPRLQLPDTALRETPWGVHETTIHDVTRSTGIAGQVAYTVVVTDRTYPHEEGETVTDESTLTFIGSIYGEPGPVVAVIGGHQMHVYEPSRFGHVFDSRWAYRFAIGREVA